MATWIEFSKNLTMLSQDNPNHVAAWLKKTGEILDVARDFVPDFAVTPSILKFIKTTKIAAALEERLGDIPMGTWKEFADAVRRTLAYEVKPAQEFTNMVTKARAGRGSRSLKEHGDEWLKAYKACLVHPMPSLDVLKAFFMLSCTSTEIKDFRWDDKATSIEAFVNQVVAELEAPVSSEAKRPAPEARSKCATCGRFHVGTCRERVPRRSDEQAQHATSTGPALRSTAPNRPFGHHGKPGPAV